MQSLLPVDNTTLRKLFKSRFQGGNKAGSAFSQNAVRAPYYLAMMALSGVKQVCGKIKDSAKTSDIG